MGNLPVRPIAWPTICSLTGSVTGCGGTISVRRTSSCPDGTHWPLRPKPAVRLQLQGDGLAVTVLADGVDRDRHPCARLGGDAGGGDAKVEIGARGPIYRR